MKFFKVIIIVALVCVNVLNSNAQVNIGNLVKQAVTGGPSADEIGSGLKEALEAGVSKGSDRLSVTDGFLGNAAVKLLFPPEAQKIERALRGVGAGKLCDDFIMSLNRAAEDAAKEANTEQLKAAFQPVITKSLDKAGAAKNWEAVTTAYNKIPLTSKVNTDLNDYATQKAIAGLFHEIAQEELKIRSNTSARNSPLLQKVFGYADKNKR
jgi:hypothetical protein